VCVCVCIFTLILFPEFRLYQDDVCLTEWIHDHCTRYCWIQGTPIA